MSTELRIPNVGESIQEVQIGKWLRHEGDFVDEDENVVELETEKASLELPAPVAGVLRITKKQGEAATIGETIAFIEPAEKSAKRKPASGSGGGSSEAESAEKTAEPPAKTGATESSSRPESGKSESAPKAANGSASRSNQADSAPRTQHATPSARRALREHDLSADDVEAAGKQLRREDVERHVELLTKAAEHDVPTPQHVAPPGQPAAGKTETAPEKVAEKVAEKPAEKAAPRKVSTLADATDRERIVPMTMIRRKIAERLVQAQQRAALLTTYNEADMTAVMQLRDSFGGKFKDKHGIKLGFMSFFVKAVVTALKEVPGLNGEIRDTNIVYRDRYDIGVAIGSEHGLVVPVIRDADRLSFAEIELAIADFATRASSRKLEPGELSGGTFTISNGGIYGSLLSTPIVNPPQSGVLGMHTIQERPVARDKQVVIRPMMYLALTYDHRIVDGREAVTWLRRVKESIEDPSRMLFEI